MKKPIFLSILLLFAICSTGLSRKARFFSFESGLRLSYAQSSPMNSPRPDIASPSAEGSSTREPNGETGMGGRMAGMGPEEMRESMKNIFSPGEGLKPEEFLDKNRILISEEIKEEIKDMGDIQAQLVGIFDLKGFTGLHRIYYIPWKESVFEKQS